jgi:hypothetical protein
MEQGWVSSTERRGTETLYISIKLPRQSVFHEIKAPDTKLPHAFVRAAQPQLDIKHIELSDK